MTKTLPTLAVEIFLNSVTSPGEALILIIICQNFLRHDIFFCLQMWVLFYFRNCFLYYTSIQISLYNLLCISFRIEVYIYSKYCLSVFCNYHLISTTLTPFFNFISFDYFMHLHHFTLFHFNPNF